MFTPRLTKPEAKNPYYNRIANGGYSGAIKGNPTDAGCDTLANCVGYAAGRFNEIIGSGKFVFFQHPPNAEDFMDAAIAAGLQTGTKPKLGAIICWAKGKTHTSSDGAGHVAVVEDIKSDGSIITSESGYNAKSAFWTTHRYRESGNWGESTAYRFLGFIYLPDSVQDAQSVTVSGTIRKGDTGDSVKWLQQKLAALGYLRKNEIDGDFGRITLGALLCFQFEHSLQVDGICGPQTQAALTK